MERIDISRRPDLLDEVFRRLKRIGQFNVYIEDDFNSPERGQPYMKNFSQLFRISFPGLDLTGPEIMHYVRKELAPKTKKTWRERAKVIATAICNPAIEREWLALIEEIEETVKKEE